METIDKIVKSSIAPKRTDVVWFNTTDKSQYIFTSDGKWTKVSGGGDSTDEMQEITYLELKKLRNQGKLVPGKQYRITDYVTTTAQADTQSAGHQFDIIVTADDVDKLNENARAINHIDTFAAIRAFSEEDGVNLLFKRCPQADNTNGGQFPIENQIAWALINGSDDAHINDSPVDWNDVRESYIYSETETLSVGDVLIDNDGFNEFTYTINEVGNVSEPNSYFTNSKLESWELKYCLDNDTNRFSWAQVSGGTGVIYYMKDEWNNECPYDFKNIQFQRKVVNDKGYYELDEQNGTDTWLFTFAANEYDIQDDSWSNLLDGSLESPYMHMSDEGGGMYINNTIKPYIEFYPSSDEPNEAGLQYLNDIVFIGYYQTNPSNGDWAYPYCSYNNTFGYDCRNNTFGNLCRHNTFGNNCYSNVFGNICYSNVFGANYISNILGNSCSSNTFGEGCGSNTFGEGCQYNIFGSSFQYNTFGEGCQYNIFGSSCQYNTFGSGCQYNTFENYCYSNTFGNNCYFNTFGNGCHNNNFTINYNTFSNYLQYINVLSGYSASDAVPSGIVLNAAYPQIVGKNSQGVFTAKNPLD